MAAFAIVIGIDDYANPEWRLSAAVQDALRFAEWACTAGGVPPENLRLLLSPAAPVESPVPYLPADARTIRETVVSFQEGAGAGGDRLYVYFAGHGSSAPGVMRGRDLEPVLVPADVGSLQVDGFKLLGFSAVVTALRGVEPAEQLFFIDACRDLLLEDFEPAVGAGVGPWVPPGDTAASHQYVLYATSPGQRAFEESARGSGVFADVLLPALRGELPAAAVWAQGTERYEVRFTTLASLVQAQVRKRLSTLAGGAQFVQVPESVARGGDLVLAHFTVEEVGTVPVLVRLGPSQARTSGQVQLVYSVPGVPGGYVAKAAGPPAEQSLTLEVSPGVYSLQARADGYVSHREPCEVYEPRDVRIRLQAEDAPAIPASPAPAPPAPVPPAPAPTPTDDGPAARRAATPATPPVTTGALLAVCTDPTAAIVVRDAEHRVCSRGRERVSLEGLPTGIYSVQLEAVEGAAAEQLVEVTAGEEARVVVDAPGPRLGADQLEMLAGLGIRPDHGYLHPTEEFSGFANASFASLLAFAAVAAQWPNPGEMTRLRRFGVPTMTHCPPGRAAVMVLVGVSGDRPAPGLGREDVLGGAEVVLRDLEGLTLHTRRLTPLPGMPAAGQVSADLVPGSIIAELRLPGRAPTRYALCGLPDRLTLLVAALEDSGGAEVQQYVVPLRGDEREFLLADPKNVRRLEVAQRVHRLGRPLPPEVHAADVLGARLRDPVLGALAGYELARHGRAAELRETAVPQMLASFGGLPDSHVLAALAEPERRDEHLTAAARLGVPVFADGFRALYEWCAEHSHTVRSLWTDPDLLLPGSTWTAWVASRPALRAPGSRMQPPPLGWEVLERRRPLVDPVLPAVGRFIDLDSPYPYSTTAFLVAPDVALTMAVGLPAAGIGRCVVDFADGEQEPARTVPVTEALGTVGTGDGVVVALRLGTGPGVTLPAPLRPVGRLPAPSHGRTVFVAGFPERDARVPPAAAAVFGDVYGVKRVQPGQLLEVTETDILHDCLTMAGNSGSPVLDLDSGLVLAVHYAAEWLEYKRGRAVSLWTPAVRQALTPLGVEYAG